MSGLVSPFDASSARYTNSPKRPRGTKEDLRHGDLLAKNIDRIRWRLWHGRPQGALDLINEILEELEMPNRQIQLTAAYHSLLGWACLMTAF